MNPTLLAILTIIAVAAVLGKAFWDTRQQKKKPNPVVGRAYMDTKK